MHKFMHIALVAAVAVAALSLGARDASAARKPMALGISHYNVDDQANGGYADLSKAEEYKSNVGRYPAIWQVWSDWGATSAPFPTDLMNGIKQKGMTPLVTWEPAAGPQSTCAEWSLDAIISGTHDSYIRTWATAAAEYGGRILLRFAHEMNGDWFIWGRDRCANTPTKFRLAWRHVWNIFKGLSGVGALEVKFVWNPINDYKLNAFYPGNSYVDYVGVTAFNRGSIQWRSMVAAFKSTMSGLANMGNTKPVIGVEVGSAPDYRQCSTCIKADWITVGYPAVYHKWPKVKAIVYFDVDMREITNNIQPDWRLISPPDAHAAYVTIGQRAKFQGAIP